MSVYSGAMKWTSASAYAHLSRLRNMVWFLWHFLIWYHVAMVTSSSLDVFPEGFLKTSLGREQWIQHTHIKDKNFYNLNSLFGNVLGPVLGKVTIHFKIGNHEGWLTAQAEVNCKGKIWGFTFRNEPMMLIGIPNTFLILLRKGRDKTAWIRTFEPCFQ